MTWFRETLHPELEQAIRIDEDIYQGKTAFQSVRIFRNEILGRVLVLDDVVQTTELDEFVYHEMLTHVPILAHGNVGEVLIIGGGDGGCLEEVLKHPVTRATMVELDPDIVTLCREHLPAICGDAFDDKRTNLIIGDGAKFVAETADRFDLIIVDSTDPIGPSQVLFQEEFYGNCRRCLTDRGILITQNGVAFYQSDELRQSSRAFAKLFARGGFYFATVPTYIGGAMALGWASDGTDLAHPNVDELTSRYRRSGIETRYYNPDVHAGAFAMPNFVRDLTG